MSELTRQQLADAWIGVSNIEHATERQIAYARAIESAATEPLLQRIAELERKLEEAQTVLQETGLLLHHFWCDVQMNEYSFEKLNKGIESIDAAIQKGQS